VKVPKQNLKRCWKPPLPLISNFSVSSIPEGRPIRSGIDYRSRDRSSRGGRFQLSGGRLGGREELGGSICGWVGGLVVGWLGGRVGGWVVGGWSFPPDVQKLTPAKIAKIEVRDKNKIQNKTQAKEQTPSKRHARTAKSHMI